MGSGTKPAFSWSEDHEIVLFINALTKIRLWSLPRNYFPHVGNTKLAFSGSGVKLAVSLGRGSAQLARKLSFSALRNAVFSLPQGSYRDVGSFVRSRAAESITALARSPQRGPLAAVGAVRAR